ncbi:MAG: segregation/condensation protein A [Dissulfurispiraceae bacterium]|jgi:segregation and condensation protein A|nr:segregation/condensation protein A [Dissulfurispiraceae bacterium]
MTEQLNIYNIKIPVFEGPLDLLLHLIKENKLDIYDIPIAEITSQYLEYIEIMKELNLEIASEFLVMAATLIYIKSRMLLPPDETIQQDEQEDPRANLVQRLLEYQAFKEASAPLREREDIWPNAYARTPEKDDVAPAPEPELMLFDVNMFDLMSALKKILGRVPPEVLKITRETLTVKDRMALIMEKVGGQENVRFDDLFVEADSRVDVIVTFLALLESLRLGLVRAYQDSVFGSIWILQNNGEEAVAAENEHEEVS